MKNNVLRFPDDFLWGTATSSYQIEGGLTNDWSQWEQSPRRLADLKRRKLGPAEEYQSGMASNSWEHLEDDIAAIKRLNNNSYRFSIEWSRVEPEEGYFDEDAIARYVHFVQRLKEEGIEPFVTLWHWPLPLWLHKKGGWEKQLIIKYFARYSEKMAAALGTVKFWITLNEPTVYASNSFMIGIWPPQKKNPLVYVRVLKNLALAHRAAYDAIKKIRPKTQVGVATHNIYFEAASGFINRLLAGIADWFWNFRFLDRIADKQDFIGLNSYFHNRINYGFGKNENLRLSDMGWELYPQALYHTAKDLDTRYHKSIYITEAGLADEKDKNRTWYIMEGLKAAHRAIAEGVDIRGYQYWSLLDNFEWAYGFGPKFGLFAIDRKTWQRIPRSSADVYARIAKDNAVVVE